MVNRLITVWRQYVPIGNSGWHMTAFAALIYGFLASFVLSAAGNNQRQARQHSVALLRMGYLLCGVSAGASAILTYIVIRHIV